MGQGKQKSEAGRLSSLRKYIPTSEDAVIVKEMIADGLSDDQILEALGHVGQKPSHSVLPNGHEYSNQLTTEQQEREAKAAGLGQPGESEGGDEAGSGDGEGDDDVLTHVAGLLSSVTKKRANKKVK